MFFRNLSLRYKIAFGTGIPMILLVFLSFIAISSSSSQVESNALVDHTHNVIEQAMRIEAAAVDMETGMRGYLLAGKEEFLAPYINGQSAFSERVNKLKSRVSDNPVQVARLNDIQSNISEWVSKVTEPAIQLRRDIGDAKTMDDIADLIAEAKGKVYFDKFRGQVALFIEREAKLLEARQKQSDEDFGNALQIINAINLSGVASGSDLVRLSGYMRSQEEASGWVGHTYKVIGTTQEILASAVDMETGMRGYLLAGRAEFLEPYEKGKERFESLINKQKQTVSDNPAQVTLLDDMLTTINEWQSQVVESNINLRAQIGDAKTMNDMAQLVGEARGKVYFDKFRQQIAEFIHIEDELMLVRQASAKASASNTNTTILVGMVVAIILGFSVSWLTLKSITVPVDEVAKGLSALANGDLTREVDIDSLDELGMMARNYNQAVSRTNKAMKEVLSTTEEVTLGSKSILQANDDMAHELTQQSDQVTQIASSIEQMSLSIQEVALKSADATTSAQNAGVTANSGGDIVKNTIGGMNSIDEAVTASSTSVQELGNRGSKIGEIIGVINDIAEQTNLLALNAAIEAARAGEAGRGFAVVADEVRTLADRTTSATKEIAHSIEAIQSETQAAVEGMESGTAYVKEGLELAHKAGVSLDDIVEGAQEVASMIDSIAAAAEEQSQASSEVSKNVESVSEVSRHANEQASLAAMSARELEQKAETLKALVGQFKV
ncbi:CHASE3 domain-containing protein [Vibrio sp. 10N.261.55.A7]|uniref:CHASE3 domain-containing protein n=1 Tax=Vibrio sp. 10N.261.55.A7 TaxID=1880851 RepID=UPI000C84DE08|nr:CHASE3 domain-containing protein [Vibrio sp. 10N.261.55.A7]PMK00879.1 chemotaxis protein [Vibrio sp. 10N.261.55.A7]